MVGRQVLQEVETFIDDIKERFSDVMVAQLLKKGEPPHFYSIVHPIVLARLCGAYRVPILTSTLKKYKAGLMIRLHYFRGTVDDFDRMLKYIRKNKPKDVAVVLRVNNSPYESKVGYYFYLAAKSLPVNSPGSPMRRGSIAVRLSFSKGEPIFFIF